MVNFGKSSGNAEYNWTGADCFEWSGPLCEMINYHALAQAATWIHIYRCTGSPELFVFLLCFGSIVYLTNIHLLLCDDTVAVHPREFVSLRHASNHSARKKNNSSKEINEGGWQNVKNTAPLCCTASYLYSLVGCPNAMVLSWLVLLAWTVGNFVQRWPLIYVFCDAKRWPLVKFATTSCCQCSCFAKTIRNPCMGTIRTSIFLGALMVQSQQW